MNRGMIARATININATGTKVWNALVSPEAIRQYFFGTNVISDWHEGSSIIWKGEWQGKSYEDKGTILQLETGRTLQYSHFSPLSGLPDKPENYHTVTIKLSANGHQTHVILAQDNNSTNEERQESTKNWEMMLTGLKKYVEKANRRL